MSSVPEVIFATRAYADAIHAYRDNHSSERMFEAIHAWIAEEGWHRLSEAAEALQDANASTIWACLAMNVGVGSVCFVDAQGFCHGMSFD
ncbi:MAG TPA: hypothetical protein ACQGQG_08110 [Xylella sp.]